MLFVSFSFSFSFGVAPTMCLVIVSKAALARLGVWTDLNLLRRRIDESTATLLLSRHCHPLPIRRIDSMNTASKIN